MKTPPGNDATAYSYLRFSSPAQADGDSVRRQNALRDAWLARHPHVTLDATLTLEDRATSGFSARHRKDHRFALAQFLDRVRHGLVLPGSYLIVENLDRITREDPEQSIPAVLALISAGVRIVQLAPSEVVYESGMDLGRLFVMLLELSRGHQESSRKSGTLGAVWAQKKLEARGDADGTNKAPHGRQVPAWIELEGGTYRARADAAAAVCRIFDLSAAGLGTLAIAARLTAERVPPIARARRWVRSYVAKILDNRAVLGEYQPMKGHRERVPDGEPIVGYWPAVVTQQQWDRAHLAKDARNKRSGRPGKKGDYVYPFSGMVRCAIDECPMHVVRRKGTRYLVSGRAAQGEAGARWVLFPVEVFSKAILSRLAELQACDLFSDPGGARVTELEAQLAGVAKRLAAALARFEIDPESPTWADRVSQYDREQRALVRELSDARRAVANPLTAAWAEAVALIAADDPQRLRAALLATVEAVHIVVVGRGKHKLAAAQVQFRGGSCRTYAVLFRHADTGAAPSAPAAWWPAAVPGDAVGLDLRCGADARLLEEALRAAI